MYPDPITPKSHQDLLQKVDYDPFGVMPGLLPRHPRIFATPAMFRRAAARIHAGDPVDTAGLKALRAQCGMEEELPDTIPAPDKENLAAKLQGGALRCALVFHLTGETGFRERAMASLRLVATSFHRQKWTGYEFHAIAEAASIYDCLRAGPIEEPDDALFREMLTAHLRTLDLCVHRYCNNHNVFDIMARLAVGLALGDPRAMHDALYGCSRDGKWRYGFIHQLRHDLLCDGMQWEGAMGYHMLVMGGLAETATMLENVGVDIWRRELPPLSHDDGHDEHRGYGSPRARKCLKAGLDAFFYQMMPNGDYSQLHDQILGNIRGGGCWWPLFAKGYEIYGDPKYAWLLSRIQRERPGELPFHFRNSDSAFIRLENRALPAGDFSFVKNTVFSLAGRHVNGCSLFPVHGSTVLRAEPAREDSLAAYLYWGPHWAGHRAPAALHLDIHARGRRITTSPHIWDKGYDDPRHLSWGRSTIAHNTVAVDEASMFPFDYETDSPWEYDHWRDNLSDGKLEGFQPEADFRAVRASNENVYPGVRLDRTVLLTPRLLVDVYRVTSDTAHLYDWALHCHGTFMRPADGQPVKLGERRGYRHFGEAWLHADKAGWTELPFTFDGVCARPQFLLPADSSLIVARDPEPDSRTPIGDLMKPQPRTSLIVRTRAAKALFLSVWTFDDAPLTVDAAGTKADGDVILTVTSAAGASRWRFPASGPVEKADG